MARMKAYVDESWVPTAPGKGGYAFVVNLAAPPSLYRTSWMLRIRQMLGLKPSGLDAGATAAWLESYIREPRQDEGLPMLETIALATQALRALDAPATASEVASAIESLRSRGQYRWDAGEPSTLAATAVAVTTLHDADAAVPVSVVSAARTSLSAFVTSSVTLQSFADRIGPAWQVADIVLPDADRAPFRERLSRVLFDIAGQIGAQSALEGPGLALLEVVGDIGRANNVTLDLPRPNVTGLIAPDGLVAAVASGPSDPQTTWLAISLGWTPPMSGLESVKGGAGPYGWTALGMPEPEATYYGLEAAAAVSAIDHRTEVAAQVAAWLQALGSERVLTADRWRETYFTIAAALDLGLTLPGGLSGIIGSSIATVSPDDASALLAVHLARLLRIPAPSWAISATLDQPRTARAVLAAQVEGSAEANETMADKARQDMAALRLPGGTYRTSAEATTPDILATALGIRVFGDAKAPTGPDQAFSSRDGFWLMPPTSAAGNALNLQTLYLGLFLGGRADEAGVI